MKKTSARNVTLQKKAASSGTFSESLSTGNKRTPTELHKKASPKSSPASSPSVPPGQIPDTGIQMPTAKKERGSSKSRGARISVQQAPVTDLKPTTATVLHPPCFSPTTATAQAHNPRRRSNRKQSESSIPAQTDSPSRQIRSSVKYRGKVSTSPARQIAGRSLSIKRQSLDLYHHAMEFFQRQDYIQAKDVLELLLTTPSLDPEISSRARVFLKICTHRAPVLTV